MTGTLGNCRPTHVGTQMLPFPAVNHHKEDLQLCYKSESSRWKPATTDHDAKGWIPASCRLLSAKSAYTWHVRPIWLLRPLCEPACEGARPAEAGR